MTLGQLIDNINKVHDLQTRISIQKNFLEMAIARNMPDLKRREDHVHKLEAQLKALLSQEII